MYIQVNKIIKTKLSRGEALLFVETFKCWEVFNGVLSYK